MQRRTCVMVSRASTRAFAALAPVRERAHAARLRLKRLRPLADGSERGYHIVRQHAFAVEAAPARSATIVRDPRLGLGAREALVDGEDVADVGVAGVFPSDPGGIGCGRLELLPNGLRRVEQADGVAQALGHLRLAVQPQDTLRRG